MLIHAYKLVFIKSQDKFGILLDCNILFYIYRLFRNRPLDLGQVTSQKPGIYEISHGTTSF